MLLKYQNKVIGELENGVFHKKVSDNKHLMKIYDAYGIDAQAFREHLLNAKIVIESESGIYESDAKTFQEKGIERDFGYGKQIFLSRKFFTRRDENQLTLQI